MRRALAERGGAEKARRRRLFEARERRGDGEEARDRVVPAAVLPHLFRGVSRVARVRRSVRRAGDLRRVLLRVRAAARNAARALGGSAKCPPGSVCAHGSCHADPRRRVRRVRRPGRTPSASRRWSSRRGEGSTGRGSSRGGARERPQRRRRVLFRPPGFSSGAPGVLGCFFGFRPDGVHDQVGGSPAVGAHRCDPGSSRSPRTLRARVVTAELARAQIAAFLEARG